MGGSRSSPKPPSPRRQIESSLKVPLPCRAAQRFSVLRGRPGGGAPSTDPSKSASGQTDKRRDATISVGDGLWGQVAGWLWGQNRFFAHLWTRYLRAAALGAPPLVDVEL